ncbi:MAG: hypothetical protein JWN33_594 [Candidatus Saccharibacteria bacterium]|nr:hypothetical protein [Candidatus Saccharibacteria bacterium]
MSIETQTVRPDSTALLLPGEVTEPIELVDGTSMTVRTEAISIPLSALVATPSERSDEFELVVSTNELPTLIDEKISEFFYGQGWMEYSGPEKLERGRYLVTFWSLIGEIDVMKFARQFKRLAPELIIHVGIQPVYAF